MKKEDQTDIKENNEKLKQILSEAEKERLKREELEEVYARS